MNGVAIVIYVNMTLSCLYQIVPYMYSSKKKKKWNKLRMKGECTEYRNQHGD